MRVLDTCIVMCDWLDDCLLIGYVAQVVEERDGSSLRRGGPSRTVLCRKRALHESHISGMPSLRRNGDSDNGSEQTVVPSLSLLKAELLLHHANCSKQEDLDCLLQARFNEVYVNDAHIPYAL